MEEPENLTSELLSIQKAVNEASEHTKRQLESIDTNLSIGVLLAAIAAIGITYVLKISEYWIPTAFLMLIAWGLYSLLPLITQKRKKETINQNIDDFFKIDPVQMEYGIDFVLRNVLPFIKALTIIYVLSFIAILATVPPWFDPLNVFTYIPIIACLIWFTVPFLTDNIVNFFELKNIKKLRDDVSSFPSPGKNFFNQIIIYGGLFLFAVVYTILLIILPLISLIITYPVTTPLIDNLRYIVLVLMLQGITLIITARYFNALAVQKELNNALTNYADLHAMAQYRLFRKEFELSDIENLKHSVLTSKRYEIVVDDSMKLFNFYLLIPNRVNVRETTSVKEKASMERVESPEQ